MKCEKCPLLIIRWNSYNPNFFYFTNFDIDHSILLITKGRKIIFTNEMNYELCKKELGKKFEIKKMKLKEVKEELKKIKETILVDGNIPAYIYAKIKIKNMKIGYEEFQKMREVKNKKEIEKIKKASKITLEIIENIDVKNKYEYEIKNNILIESFMRNVDKAFKPIIANASNAKYPHYNKYDSKITNYCLIDYGVEYEKYKSDLTRCEGKLVGKIKRDYEKLKNLNEEIADSSYAGMKICDFIDNVEKRILKNNLKKFNHTIGHGVGLEIHEFPFLNKKNKGVLLENSIITLEPGQYTKDYGIRYEDMYIVSKKKLKKI